MTTIASILALGGVACTIVTNNNPDAGTTADGGSSVDTTGDGGGGGDSAASGDGGASGGTGNFGSVSLSSNTLTVGTMDVDSHSASAFFALATASTGAVPTSKCTATTDGSCSISECDTTPVAAVDAGAVADAGTPPKPPHAGAIAITGGVIDTAGIALAVGDTGYYTPASGQTALWEGGEDITVKAVGDTVPAFDQKIKAPSIVTLTVPTLPAAGTPMALDRTKALDVTWTGGESGTVSVSVFGSAGNKSTSISCSFPASNNNGSISAAALAKLPVVAATPDVGSFSLSNTSATAFKQGDWTLSLSASSFGKAGASYATAQLTIK